MFATSPILTGSDTAFFALGQLEFHSERRELRDLKQFVVSGDTSAECHMAVRNDATYRSPNGALGDFDLYSLDTCLSTLRG